jgi:hypothetical protein
MDSKGVPGGYIPHSPIYSIYIVNKAGGLIYQKVSPLCTLTCVPRTSIYVLIDCAGFCSDSQASDRQ